MTNSARRQSEPAPRAEATAFDLLLTSGGDERIWPDPFTRRNRYGTPTLPRPDEIWFSSSTASAITPRGYAAARCAFERLTTAGRGARLDQGCWFDETRARIARTFGIPGCEVILSASGTETELLTLTLAKAILRRPLMNIVVAPDETGSGVMHAAAGTHFANAAAFDACVTKGCALQGWEDGKIAATGVALRDDAGRLRDAAAVERDIDARVETALQAGRDVLLHVLDTSKTGQSGPSRAAAHAIFEAAGDRVLIVVDACQLRCSADDIKADLRSGFMVTITGSKFAAGPPFCGALLIPPSYLERLRGAAAPPGLAAYSARFDWPLALRAMLGQENFAAVNLGMGLRWEAALSEIEAFAAIPAALRNEILEVFADNVRQRVAAHPALTFLDASLAEFGGKTPSIFPILTGDGDIAETRRIYEALRSPAAYAPQLQNDDAIASICHVGQPVVVGKRAVLRICASMPTITAIGERVALGMDLDSAFLPVRHDIDRVFRKWELVRRQAHPPVESLFSN